jgi:AraC-like DNA-binding protein
MITQDALSEQVMREVTPLSSSDCFYLADRHKSSFDFPIHSHPEFELNFIGNAAGVRRTVGDHSETIGDYDLVLIASPNLEHVWEQGECVSKNIREITIQFTSDVLPEPLLSKSQFHSIRCMLDRARCGLAFSQFTIMKVFGKIDELTRQQRGFHAVLSFLELLYDLSLADDSRTLSSSSFAHVKTSSESRRVNKVQQYIANHFREEVRLEQVAELAGMTPVAFSRFFHQRTGRTLSDYIIEIRLGFASRMLIDTTMTAAEICYDSGFNTLSNFNRLFRKHKGCSPTEFRENFNKKKIII